MTAPEVRALHVGSDHCVATCANQLVVVAQSDLQPSLVRLLPTFVRRLRAQAPAGRLRETRS